MNLINFNLTKISAEKKGVVAKEIKINSNILFLDIKETKSDLLNLKETILNINFKYTINYGEEYANLEFIGKLLLSLEPSLAKKVTEQWKEHKIEEDFRISLSNIILRRINVKSLELEEELNIPLHIPLPLLQNPKKK